MEAPTRIRAMELIVAAADRRQVASMARSHSLAAALVQRAKMILGLADGASNSAVARDFPVIRPMVMLWRGRYWARGLPGLRNELKPGRPLSTSDEQIAILINTALLSRPKARIHWTRGSLAAETALTKATVHRYLTLFGIQPHRTRSFKLSTDPFVIEKLRDIVGLYLNPPEHALVVCVDARSQVQALERTQPILPMGLGNVVRDTLDYFRHGTTTLIAALDMANGSVITQRKPRHHHQEFLGFLRHVEASVPADLGAHLICDNYATHKHPKVRAWLARQSRFHVHFTPTFSSCLNQVERWFALFTNLAIGRGSFESVTDLKRQINEFVEHYNQHSAPFVWTATADSILATLERPCEAFHGAAH